MIGPGFDDVLNAARTGAGWACTQLYEDLAGPVTGYVRQRGATDPDDVASETFLQVFRDLAEFEGDEAGFRSWVFTIAHRRMLDDRRRRGRRPKTSTLDAQTLRSDPVDPDPGPASTTVALDDEARLRVHLHTLTVAQRDVILLRVVGGLSVDEVAGIVGRRPAAVRQLQRRGLRALEARLAQVEER